MNWNNFFAAVYRAFAPIFAAIRDGMACFIRSHFLWFLAVCFFLVCWLSPETGKSVVGGAAEVTVTVAAKGLHEGFVVAHRATGNQDGLINLVVVVAVLAFCLNYAFGQFKSAFGFGA